MQLISRFNKGFRTLLRVIEIYSEYTWVITLKDKTDVTVINVFQRNLKQSTCNPHKI